MMKAKDFMPQLVKFESILEEAGIEVPPEKLIPLYNRILSMFLPPKLITPASIKEMKEIMDRIMRNMRED